jgi:hypothetical protein
MAAAGALAQPRPARVRVAGADARTRVSVRVALEGAGAPPGARLRLAAVEESEGTCDVLVICLDQALLAARPPARRDRRCLITCGDVCLCQPVRQFDAAATAAERAIEQWRAALARRLPVVALLCRGYPFPAASRAEWWPECMEEFRPQLLNMRTFDCLNMSADPLSLFMEESPLVKDLFSAATRGGARSLYIESAHVKAVRSRLGVVALLLADIRAAKKVVQRLRGARRKLQKTVQVIRLSFNAETSALMTVVDSYSLAIPALIQGPGEGAACQEHTEILQAGEEVLRSGADPYIDGSAVEKMKEWEERHRRLAEIIESFRAAVEGVRSREDEELIRAEEDIWDELVARETEVQLKAAEVFRLLVSEIFGESSPVDAVVCKSACGCKRGWRQEREGGGDDKIGGKRGRKRARWRARAFECSGKHDGVS